MSGKNTKCQFCESETGEKVLPFNKNSLEKCREILTIRINRNLKYAHIKVPNDCNDAAVYHLSCYKKFTAVKKTISTIETKNVSVIPVETASNETITSSSPSLSTSYLVTTCVFCDRQRKQTNKKNEKLHCLQSSETRAKITSKSLELNDFNLHHKICQTNVSLFYHTSCLNDFNRRHEKIYDCQSYEKENLWHVTRVGHKKALQKLHDFIKDDIILGSNIYLLSTLHEKYESILQSQSESDITYCRFEQKIRSLFDQSVLSIEDINGRKLVFRTGLPMDYVMSKQGELVKRDILTSAANILRKEILSVPVTPLPTTCSVQELLQGECNIPDALKEFNLELLGFSSGSKKKISESCLKKAESISQDQIYAVTNGRVKPAKQLALGMTIKSLTNSRKVVNILNKYGHTPSYTLLEELETEITYASIDASMATSIPSGIIPCAQLNTGVAYDNFDRYVDTASGKNTLHDTVGIIFQNEQQVDGQYPIQNQPIDLTKSSCKGKRRRAFNVIDINIEHPIKKPKMSDNLLLFNDDLSETTENIITNAKNRDLLWVLCHAAEIENSPMWVGFNNLTINDETSKQKVAYLNPINMSPTNSSVIKTTMQEAKNIAQECGQDYICVTYDLAIAKVALQIQSTERPNFDNLFIFLGTFHIILAYFKAIGKFIDDCGLTHMLIEADLLANGSLNGFMSGTHYNRCKRLHPIITLALQIIHFKFFLKEENLQLLPDLVEELKEIKQRKFDSSENILVDVDNFFLSELISKYKRFRERTLNGDHGKTAQFYMQYINLINYYLLLSRSIRENNFELYKYVLPKLTNIFFIFNHPNYARWLTKHHDDILKVQDTHPGLELHLKRHGLGIKRTDKAFSRQPIDLTLEQTINADAAKRLSGVSHFTNSLSGRQRWAKSHALRSTIITHVLEETNITRTQDVTSELQAANIAKNKNAVQKLVDTIESYGNPFDYQDDKDELYNIVTGNSVTKETADFLLNIESAGENQRKEFISQCNESPDRFEKPIKRNEVKNFCSDKSKKTFKGPQKLQAIKAERNVFGRLLGISLNQKLDLPKVLEYPLTSSSPSMSHLDGSLMKTDKAKLMKILETKVDNTDAPQNIDVVIIDGFYILHLIPEFVKTFGEMSLYILKKCMNYKAKRIDVIFDSYVSPSIKDSERKLRAEHNIAPKTQCKITSPKQIRPKNFIKELKNTQFKEELVQFFIRHWSSEDADQVISDSMVNLDFENHFYSYESNGKKVIQNDNPNLKCGDHEETDTKIIYHIYNIQKPSSILIKTSDTDVIVILLGNLDKLEKHQIYIEAGTFAKRRIVNVNKIYLSIGATLAKSMPAFHALTGCDYTPAFYRKGKLKPFNVLTKNTDYQQALIELSYDTPLTNEIKKKIEQFICELYGVKSSSVNEARHRIFLKNFKPNKENEKFYKSLMNFDAAFLPPSQVELAQQILRAKYVSNIWMNSTRNHPSNLLPTEHGWKEEDGKYVPLWYAGNRLPDRVSDVTVAENDNTSNTGDISDSSSTRLDSDDEDTEDDEL